MWCGVPPLAASSSILEGQIYPSSCGRVLAGLGWAGLAGLGWAGLLGSATDYSWRLAAAGCHEVDCCCRGYVGRGRRADTARTFLTSFLMAADKGLSSAILLLE